MAKASGRDDRRNGTTRGHWRAATLLGVVLALLVPARLAAQLTAQQPPTAPPPQTVPAPPPQPLPGASTAAAPSATEPSSVAAPSLAATTSDATAPDRAEPALTIRSRPVLPPADPAAAAAYAVLDKHCARCHQGGRLNRSSPGGDFGNILRLDELAATPHLVQPGNPDGSRLYLSVLRRLMPIDAGETHAAPPTPDEIDALRTWIASLKPRPACQDRRFVTADEQAQALRRAAAEAGPAAAHIRFLSIAHLYDGCVDFDTLAAYRQAVVRLINSLSWKPSPVAVTPVDAARTLFRLDLDELGWLPEHWERIMRSGPDPLGLSPPPTADVAKPFGTAIPVARADWFAEQVLRAPLYYDVLGLPGTGPEILKILQVDVPALQQSGGIFRSAVAPSDFSAVPSLVDRMPTRTGGLWQAFHQFAREGTGDPSTAASRPLTDPVPHHVSRIMFPLPNGLPAFAIVGQRGDRLDALPPEIALPTATPHSDVRAGLDCMACHASGPVAPKTARLASASSEALHKDAAAIADAMRRMGLTPGATLDGVDPVVALAAEYARPLSSIRAAAELFVAPQTLARLADDGDAPPSLLARRLVQGLVARAEIEERGGELVAAIGRLAAVGDVARPATDAAPVTNPGTAMGAGAATKPSATVAAPSSPGTGEPPAAASATAAAAPVAAPTTTAVPQPGHATRVADGVIKPLDPGPPIVLLSDKTRYKKGDLLHLIVRVGADCHLTVISIDQGGRGTVIFPSDFETATLLTAGQELRLPAPGAPYAFRLNEPGRERVVALCNEATASTDHIQHDFERQRFTDLGNYATFLSHNALLEPGQPGAAPLPRPEPISRTRRRGRTEASDQPARPDQITRTGITIVVE